MRVISILACSVLLVSACKTNKSANASNETAPALALSPELSAAADVRYPAVPKADIALGEKLYNGKCGRCHGLPTVDSQKAEEWPKIMDWMGPKANLDDVEKEKVLKYVLCAIDVKKK